MGEELFTRKTTTKDLFNTIYELVREGDFKNSLEYFDKIIEMDFEYPLLYENMSCIKFWDNRKEKIEELRNNKIELSLFLENNLKKFEAFVSERNFPKDLIAIKAIRFYINETVINALESDDKTGNLTDRKARILLARSYIESGNIEKAIFTLSSLKKSMPYDGLVLSLIAEAYYRANNIKASKMYIRDALFYGVFSIDFDMITIPEVDIIIDTIESRGVHSKSREDILAWMFAYSELMNILDVKRSFNEGEEVNLRRMISKLEAEYRKVKSRDTVAPKLMSAYALLTTYLVMNGDKKDVNEVAILGRKMAMIDRDLVEYYIKILDFKKR